MIQYGVAEAKEQHLLQLTRARLEAMPWNRYRMSRVRHKSLDAA